MCFILQDTRRSCLSCATHSTTRHNILAEDFSKRIKAHRELNCYRVHSVGVENAVRFLRWFAGDIWFPSSEATQDTCNTFIRPPGDSLQAVCEGCHGVRISVAAVGPWWDRTTHTHTHTHTHTQYYLYCRHQQRALELTESSMSHLPWGFLCKTSPQTVLPVWVTSTFSWCEIFCYSKISFFKKKTTHQSETAAKSVQANYLNVTADSVLEEKLTLRIWIFIHLMR